MKTTLLFMLLLALLSFTCKEKAKDTLAEQQAALPEAAMSDETLRTLSEENRLPEKMRNTKWVNVYKLGNKYWLASNSVCVETLDDSLIYSLMEPQPIAIKNLNKKADGSFLLESESGFPEGKISFHWTDQDQWVGYWAWTTDEGEPHANGVWNNLAMEQEHCEAEGLEIHPYVYFFPDHAPMSIAEAQEKQHVPSIEEYTEFVKVQTVRSKCRVYSDIDLNHDGLADRVIITYSMGLNNGYYLIYVAFQHADGSYYIAAHDSSVEEELLYYATDELEETGEGFQFVVGKEEKDAEKSFKFIYNTKLNQFLDIN